MHNRMPYHDLNPTEQDAVQAWCREHQLDPAVTPVDGLIDFDQNHQEWRVEQYSRRDGRFYLAPTGDRPVTHIVRRAYRVPLPWPTVDTRASPAM